MSDVYLAAAKADRRNAHIMTSLCPPAYRAGYFASFKTAEPIYYHGIGGREALIQATLRGEVSAIRPFVGRQMTKSGLFSFAYREGLDWCLSVIARHVSGEMDRPPAGFARTVVRTHLEVVNSPGAETARQIWSRKTGHSPRDFTIRLLDELRQAGRPLKIIDLQHDTPHDAGRGVDYIFALASRGWVTVDIDQPLTEQTLVSLGPMARSAPPAT